MSEPRPPKKFSLLREELKRIWRELRGPSMTPARAATAVAVGLFIGSQPIFGCHTPLVLALCVFFQLDGAIAWVASNVSNPFFAPALLTLEVQVGGYVRTGAWIRLDQAVSQAGAFKDFAGYLFLGAPFVGAGLAVSGAVISYAFVALKRAIRPNAKPPEPYVLPDTAPPWIKAVERVAQRYAPQREASTPRERTRFHYVRTKLIGDPIAKMIANLEGEKDGALGEVLDIGTGRGQLPILLLELGRATRASGMDWDDPKIKDAQTAAGDLNASFSQGDARTADYPASDTVLLIDLIHYFSIEEQDKMLDRAADATRAGGRVVVREADTERGLRSALTLMEERIFTLLRFNRGERVRFRSAKSIAERLEQRGLSCEIVPAWGKTPFANVLIIGRRAVH